MLSAEHPRQFSYSCSIKPWRESSSSGLIPLYPPESIVESPPRLVALLQNSHTKVSLSLISLGIDVMGTLLNRKKAKNFSDLPAKLLPRQGQRKIPSDDSIDRRQRPSRCFNYSKSQHFFPFEVEKPRHQHLGRQLRRSLAASMFDVTHRGGVITVATGRLTL